MTAPCLTAMLEERDTDISSPRVAKCLPAIMAASLTRSAHNRLSRCDAEGFRNVHAGPSHGVGRPQPHGLARAPRQQVRTAVMSVVAGAVVPALWRSAVEARRAGVPVLPHHVCRCLRQDQTGCGGERGRLPGLISTRLVGVPGPSIACSLARQQTQHCQRLPSASIFLTSSRHHL